MNTKKEILTQIEINNKLINKFSESMYSPRAALGQKYLYDDTYNAPWQFVVRIQFAGKQWAYKRFKDVRSAIVFRDYVIDEIKNDLIEQNKVLENKLAKLELKKQNADYITSIENLIKRLSAKDLTSKRNQSGQQYITYDRTTIYGTYGVKIGLKDEVLVDKRFAQLRDAVTYRNRIIPTVIKELKHRLSKLGA